MQEALNFVNVSSIINEPEPNKFLKFLKNSNNINLAYPIIVLITNIIILSIILMQKGMSSSKKTLIILIYIFLLFYTIWTYRLS